MLTTRTFLVSAIGIGLLETADAFVGVPVAAPFALLFLGGAWWYARRGGIAVPILLALMFAVEVAGVPFYSRTSLSDWIVQIAGGAVSAAGLVAAVALVARRRRRPVPQAA
jgi:hypothetical protein